FAGLVKQIRVVGVFAHTQVRANFLIARLASQLTTQRAYTIAHLVALLTHLPWPPVLAAQFIEDRAANAQAGETAKRFIWLAVPAQAVEQAEQTDLLHVLTVQRRAGLQRQLADDTLDQRQITHQPALLVLRSEQRRGGMPGVGCLDGAGAIHGY